MRLIPAKPRRACDHSVVALMGLLLAFGLLTLFSATYYPRTVAGDPLSAVLKQLIGDTAEQLRAALERVGYTAYTMTGYDFDLCLATCRKLAQQGGCVLLSPACASFDMFTDYEHRGKVFKEKVMAL